MAFNPELFKVLPADALAKLKAIHAQEELGPLERYDKIAEILIALPSDVQDKIVALPPPPESCKLLPDDARVRHIAKCDQFCQAKFESVRADKSLSFKDRLAKHREIAASLPADVHQKFREAAKTQFQ